MLKSNVLSAFKHNLMDYFEIFQKEIGVEGRVKRTSFIEVAKRYLLFKTLYTIIYCHSIKTNKCQ